MGNHRGQAGFEEECEFRRSSDGFEHFSPLQLDPHDPRALIEMAQVYEEMSRPDRALVLYERALERDPHQDDVTARVNFLLAKGARRPQPD